MLFRQLEYFVAVARRSTSRGGRCLLRLAAGPVDRHREAGAGAQRHADQPGRNFEGLTPEGERLVVWAKRIIAEHDAFKSEVAVMQSGVTGTLRLGTGPTVSTTTGSRWPPSVRCTRWPG